MDEADIKGQMKASFVNHLLVEVEEEVVEVTVGAGCLSLAKNAHRRLLPT
jgi:hypothetical protein